MIPFPRRAGRHFVLAAVFLSLLFVAYYLLAPPAKLLASWEETQCAAAEPRITIIKDADHWKLTWLLVQDRGRIAAQLAVIPPPGTAPALALPPPPPAPPFNPQAAVGVAIFLGHVGSLGPRVQLDGIRTRGGRLVVDASGYYPSGPPPLMISSPCLLLQVERPNTPIVIRARFRNTYLEVTD